jgi:5-methyltetrahydrofolate--homocysteine methyltransferase
MSVKRAVLKVNRRVGKETMAEKKLRALFQKKKLPYQQHCFIDGMEVDFLLPNNVVVEVDGYVHLIPEKKQSDLRKEKRLASKGYIVKRLTNLEIFNDVRACFNQVDLLVRSISYVR